VLPPLPSNFWTGFATNSFTQTTWHLIGQTSVSSLRAGTPKVTSFQWTPPLNAPAHVALLAVIDCPQDPLLGQNQLDVPTLTRSSKHVTLSSVHTVDARLMNELVVEWAAPWMRNPSTVARRFTIRLETSESSGWDVRLVLPRHPAEIAPPGTIEGFDVGHPGPERWRALVAEARSRGALDEVAASRLGELPDPLVLTLQRQRRSAEIRDILLGPAACEPIAMIFEASALPAPSPARIDVVQLDGEWTVGGCTFLVRAGAGPPA
jgi:hypothetical protein